VIEPIKSWEYNPAKSAAIVSASIIFDPHWTSDSKFCVFLSRGPHGSNARLTVWPTDGRKPWTQNMGQIEESFSLKGDDKIILRKTVDPYHAESLTGRSSFIFKKL
jgi:hypothetical protein